MSVIAFLRKLAGSHEADRQVDREFRKRLNGVDVKNDELDRLNNELDDVLAAVSKRQSQISVESLPPAANGEHAVDSIPGDPRERQPSDPPG